MQYPQIVRANSNGVMFLEGPDSYSIYNVREHCWDLQYCSGGTARKAWARRYANTRQFVTPNGVNHRYLFSNN